MRRSSATRTGEGSCCSRSASALAATVLSVVLSVPVAVLALRRKLPGHRAFRLMVLVPARRARASSGRWPPDLLGLARLVQPSADPDPLLPLRPHLHASGLILFYLWLYFPYTCVTTLAALESLDPAIEEAGEVAGAGRWQVLRHVLLPLVTPGILAGSFHLHGRLWGLQRPLWSGGTTGAGGGRSTSNRGPDPAPAGRAPARSPSSWAWCRSDSCVSMRSVRRLGGRR